MRKIGFRGWNSKTKEMYYNGFVIDTDGDVVSSWDEAINYPTDIMQFTGLKDKNGKDIYEGDIVSVVDGEYSEVFSVLFGTYEDCKGFSHTGFYFDNNQGADTSFIDKEDITQYTVIGNIYESPHLLDTPKDSSDKAK